MTRLTSSWTGWSGGTPSNFPDDLAFHQWSSGYDVNNAIYRVTVVLEGKPRTLDRQTTLRKAWNEAFHMLEKTVAGTISGTTGAMRPPRRIGNQRKILKPLT
jgi:3-phenylpropionate/cinnamic acid dioxygenase small subunit